MKAWVEWSGAERRLALGHVLGRQAGAAVQPPPHPSWLSGGTVGVGGCPCSTTLRLGNASVQAAALPLGCCD